MGPSRVLRGALGRLEPYETEVSRTVLRGREASDGLLLPDVRHEGVAETVLLSP
jgi:hypothetical protein